MEGREEAIFSSSISFFSSPLRDFVRGLALFGNVLHRLEPAYHLGLSSRFTSETALADNERLHDRRAE